MKHRPKDGRKPSLHARLRKLTIISGSVLGVTAILVGGAYIYLVATPSTAPPALTGTVSQRTVRYGGQDRTYETYTPANLPAGSPVVAVLHGSFQDGPTIRKATNFEFDELADLHKFAVVYPDGFGQGWNDCRRDSTTPAHESNIDDVGFVNDLVSEIADKQHTASERYFVVGYSNGGQMALRLAAEAPDRLAGLALISANIPAADNNACEPPTANVPTLIMSGTADPISPYEGGPVSIFGLTPRGNVVSAAETTKVFVESNGLSLAPETVTMPHVPESGETSVTVLDYSEEGKSPVRQYIVHKGGHVVPSRIRGFGRIFGTPTFDVDAPTEIWDFFSAR